MRQTLLCLAVLSTPAAAQVTDTECRASLSAFSAIQPGMTYEQVASIIGCDGVEISRSDLAGYVSTMFAWEGAGSMGANMNAMFQNGTLVFKAQAGLR